VRRRSARLIALLGAAAAAALLTAPAASATFHLMKIREISPGTDGQDDSFVEVQMYAQLQNFLSGGAALLVCNTGCTPTPVTFSPFTDVAHGNSQDTVVFGDSGVASASKDFNVNLNLDQNKAGGAVCYLSEPGFHDCVAWGTFSAASKLTGTYGSAADPGTPAAALTSGMAHRRSEPEAELGRSVRDALLAGRWRPRGISARIPRPEEEEVQEGEEAGGRRQEEVQEAAALATCRPGPASAAGLPPHQSRPP
jgi:hypothetical protein